MENSNYYELRLDFTDFRMKDSSCLKNDGSVHEKPIQMRDASAGFSVNPLY